MAYNTRVRDENIIREINEGKRDEFFDFSTIDLSTSGNRKWTNMDVLEVGLKLVVEGSVPQVAKMTGIPQAAIYHWRKSHWWPDFMKECRKQKQEELDAKMTEVLQEAVDSILDRIAGGEYKLNKDGTIERVPASMRDLAMTTGVFFDKRALIRGDATSNSMRSISNDDTLKKLEKRFVDFAQKMENSGKKPKSTVTDLERAG